MKRALLIGLIVMLTLWAGACNLGTEDPLLPGEQTTQLGEDPTATQPYSTHQIDTNVDQKTDTGIPKLSKQTGTPVQKSLTACTSSDDDCDQDPLQQVLEPDPHPWKDSDE